MTRNHLCNHCGEPVTFAKGNRESDDFTPGDYFQTAIQALGTGYGRQASYQSVHVHWRCLDAWNATNGNKTPAAQPALS